MSEVFHFKRFSACHGKSAMKIGVDAVLIGVWTDGSGSRTILDAGTGSGVISLILTQRFPECEITGIDTDPESIKEASQNFLTSPWPERLTAEKKAFPSELKQTEPKYDLIVSNPPFFDSGIKNPLTPREIARHQGSLSVFELLNHSKKFLNPGGSLSMIFPIDMYERVKEFSQNKGWSIKKSCFVRDSCNRPLKRAMVQFTTCDVGCNIENEPEILTMFEKGIPTEKYKNLCKDFYLKF